MFKCFQFGALINSKVKLLDLCFLTKYLAIRICSLKQYFARNLKAQQKLECCGAVCGLSREMISSVTHPEIESALAQVNAPDISLFGRSANVVLSRQCHFTV